MNYAGKFGAEFFDDNLGLQSGGRVHTQTVHATHAPQDAIIVSDAQLLFNGEFKRSGASTLARMSSSVAAFSTGSSAAVSRIIFVTGVTSA